ncbi:hypothetical protein [Ilyobacter sp.]|uniref:hypothetical protein n=1 Tax=Ilyobacter sp. TaxID=3100343 RepID=UPI0035625359
MHNFSWEDFAAWYVEIAKIALNSDVEKDIQRTKSILSYIGCIHGLSFSFSLPGR